MQTFLARTICTESLRRGYLTMTDRSTLLRLLPALPGMVYALAACTLHALPQGGVS